MVNELYEIEKVKIEFLQGIAEEYGNIFTERQLDMSLYMLNEFCNICTSNNLALIRIPEQVAEQQPTQYHGPNPFDNIPEIPSRVQQQVQQMNTQLQQSVQDVDLNTTDAPKSFAERIREMRSAPKKQPGNKVNPGDD